MSKNGLLLANLGSPDSPDVREVRRYLRRFLMDGRVLDFAWPIRFILVHVAIVPFRARSSAEAYRKIWTAEGSPLVLNSGRLQARLRRQLGEPVELAMRYGAPSIESAVERLGREGVDSLTLAPLFPHYAMSSYETVVCEVESVAQKRAPKMAIEVVPPFYDHPDYIDALVAVSADALAGDYDHLLFSFHGLPERHLRKADPTGQHCLATPDCCNVESKVLSTCYRAQCFRTVAAFVRRADVPSGKYSVSFQSRLGRTSWLRPYTAEELAALPRRGVSRLVVICPSFVADCLETLEEIGIRGRETFIAAGGREMVLVPSLNDHPIWGRALERMIAATRDRQRAAR